MKPLTIIDHPSGETLCHQMKLKALSIASHSGTWKSGSTLTLHWLANIADWTSASLKGKEQEYTYIWSADDTAELDTAVQALKSIVTSEEDVLKVGARAPAARDWLVTYQCGPTDSWHWHGPALAVHRTMVPPVDLQLDDCKIILTAIVKPFFSLARLPGSVQDLMQCQVAGCQYDRVDWQCFPCM